MPLYLNGTDGVYGVNGTTAKPAVRGTDETGNGIFYGTDTVSVATNGTTAVTVDSSQNVGIGTASPSCKLDIVTTGQALRFATAAGQTNIEFRDTTNSKSGYLNYDNDALIYFSNGPTERARIDSSGRLQVNITNGTGQCNITGSQGFNNSGTGVISKAGIVINGSYGGALSLIDGSVGYAFWCEASGADFYLRRQSTSGSWTGGVYISNAATSWSAASDERLKNIIRPIDNAIDKIKDFRCVIGEYKDNLGVERPFLIAQDVQKTIPEIVNVMNGDTGYLGMSYTELIPVLTKAIQELSAKLDAAEARIAALEAK